MAGDNKGLTTMSDTKDTPEWMTDEWLASAKLLTDSPTWEWSKVAGAAREILRLRAELADQTKARTAAEQLVRLTDAERIREGEARDGVEAELAKVTAERDASRSYAGSTEAAHRRMVDLCARVQDERDAAIRDRNEFSASELERFAASDWRGGYTAWAQIRAAELRKVAGAAAPVDLPRRECKAVDVSAPAPAADARQPDDAAKLAEVEKREADGIKLFDDLLATERAAS